MATVASMLQGIYRVKRQFSVTIQDTWLIISDLFLMSLANS